MYYRKWPNKRTLPNKRLLSYKSPLYAVKIVLDALSNQRPLRELAKKEQEQNHSIHSVSCLINKA